ncbi:MAG: Brp/Blh family beta-carotene 15,15'-dioxygenase [Rubricoccaceae bacterium]
MTRTIRRTVLWPSRLALAAVLAAVLATVLAAELVGAPGADALPPWVLYAPFAASVLLFGLPHGAVDHLAMLRLARARAGPLPLLAVLAAYLAVGGAYAALWFTAPATAFASFIALTWLHWGQGDVHALVGLEGARHLNTRAARLGTAFVRGALPMLVPLLAHPEAYRAVAEAVVDRIAPGAADALAWAFSPGFRRTAGAALGLTAAALLAHGQRVPGARADALRDAADVALLGLFFWFVPPVLAVGLYFSLWHAPRHIARLLAADAPAADALGAGRSAPAWGRFALAAAPLTLGALAFGAALYAAVPVPPDEWQGYLGLYLILIAALTLPHTLVVLAMDRAQGVWSPPGPA